MSVADLAGGVDRQRAALTVRMHRDRDADNLPMHVQQRTAALSGTEPASRANMGGGKHMPVALNVQPADKPDDGRARQIIGKGDGDDH